MDRWIAAIDDLKRRKRSDREEREDTAAQEKVELEMVRESMKYYFVEKRIREECESAEESSKDERESNNDNNNEKLKGMGRMRKKKKKRQGK
ncbi:hypothetical protein L873DRAFT_1821979 [Choiromyces venosus 120613-1]|uniref:Uncharacterized protein n=1 Tax=Choiromyces venosus 120613-1 TaxID=1336337 RepID=A0A3N4IUS0_9PEZI|nr:hypothetical protein L873DRAFT_1821979 [Choiromyces venosus 120613-1]